MATESQGTYLEIGTGAAGAETVTEMTLSNPTILTTVGHSVSNGDIGTLSNFAGADAADINSKVRVAHSVTTDTYAVDVDLTGKTVDDNTNAALFTPVTWQAVGEIVDINRDDPGANEIDTTHLTSVAKEYLLGLKDSGTYTLSVNFLFSDTGQIALRAAQTARTALSCKVTYPDASTMSFTAYVQTFNGPGASVDDKLIGDVTLKISGAIVIA